MSYRTSSSEWQRSDWINLSIVLVLCGLVAYARWLKMESLTWADPARWLFESSRVAAGEMPYRDFSWQYPPFAVLALGWAMKLFGVRFLVAQLVIDAISVVTVLLAFILTRYLLPPLLRLPAMFLFIAVCATSQMKFALFSFLTYVPALQTGAAGCMLVLAGVIHYLRSGVLSVRNAAAMAAGVWVASLSKPEALIGAVAIMLVLALVDRRYWYEKRPTVEWLRRYAGLLAACFIPVLLAYSSMALVAGPANLLAGLTGYGLASESCPWWPTGLGIFGALAALGQATMVAALLTVVGRSSSGRNWYQTVGPLLIGAALYLSYFCYLNRAVWLDHRSWASAFKNVLPTLLWTNAILIPAMWVSIVCWTYLLVRVLFPRRTKPPLSSQSVELLILLTAPVLMCTRGLFNTTLDTITEVPAICYPFFLMLLPYLLWRFIQWNGLRVETPLPLYCVMALLVGYGVIRIAGGYTQARAAGPYTTLSTLAGDVRLLEYSRDAEIYRFVLDHTSPGDTVLDIPYGGGINMASGRASPAFTTQFRQLRMPDRYMRKDMDRVVLHPPRIVIAQDEPDYGTLYGLAGVACTFPALVWSPPLKPGDVDRKLPVVDFIRTHYNLSKRVGGKLVLVLKDEQPAP